MILFLFKFLFINSFQRERWGRGRERNINFLLHLFLHHWSVPVCAPTGGQTGNLGVSGQHSNQLNDLAIDSPLC